MAANASIGLDFSQVYSDFARPDASPIEVYNIDPRSAAADFFPSARLKVERLRGAGKAVTMSGEFSVEAYNPYPRQSLLGKPADDGGTLGASIAQALNTWDEGLSDLGRVFSVIEPKYPDGERRAEESFRVATEFSVRLSDPSDRVERQKAVNLLNGVGALYEIVASEVLSAQGVSGGDGEIVIPLVRYSGSRVIVPYKAPENASVGTLPTKSAPAAPKACRRRPGLYSVFIGPTAGLEALARSGEEFHFSDGRPMDLYAGGKGLATLTDPSILLPFFVDVYGKGSEAGYVLSAEIGLAEGATPRDYFRILSAAGTAAFVSGLGGSQLTVKARPKSRGILISQGKAAADGKALYMNLQEMRETIVSVLSPSLREAEDPARTAVAMALYLERPAQDHYFRIDLENAIAREREMERTLGELY